MQLWPSHLSRTYSWGDLVVLLLPLCSQYLSGQLFISSISSVTINFHPFYAWDISWHTDPALWHRLHLEISPETPWAHLVDSCCIQMTQPLTNCRSAATGDLHQPPTFAFRNECVQRLSLSLLTKLGHSDWGYVKWLKNCSSRMTCPWLHVHLSGILHVVMPHITAHSRSLRERSLELLTFLGVIHLYLYDKRQLSCVERDALVLFRLMSGLIFG